MAEISKKVVSALAIMSVYLFMLQYYQPSLMLSETITSGGDTASDYYPATFMVELLVQGRITGWSPGWYGGFPMLQFYFPLPFVVMAALAAFVPLQVAFKLVTALGIFLLPIAVFIFLHKLKFPFPVPAAGALLSLPFLFMEANSMWGGNIPSTLAGEFSYGISMALSIIFLGLVYSDAERRHWMRNGALFAAIVFAHVITAMWVVLSTSYFLLAKERKENFIYFLKLYLLSFALLGAWLVPLLFNLEYTTTYADTWMIKAGEAFPDMIAVFAVLLLPVMASFLQKRDDRILYLAYMCASAFVLFLAGEHVGVINIRFMPFLQIGLLMLAATAFFRMPQSRRRYIAIILLAVFVLQWTPENVTYIDHWMKWNYEGFEGKGEWQTFKEINEFLSGSDTRVAYEHASAHNSFGTERAFESLPLFSGRSTLEGLFMQSSPTSPFVFYIQSEISEQQSCPFHKNYPCTSFDLQKGAEHLKMFNVQHYIIVSDRAKSAASQSTEFMLAKEVKNYQIYEVVNNKNAYVTVPQYQPVMLETKQWKQDFYEWFKGDMTVHLIRPAEGVPYKTDSVENIPQYPVNAACQINETITNEKIEFTTSCVGKPHIISISYYPMWQAEKEKIYLVSPSFMLVYPKSGHVVITYKNTFIENAGFALSLLGVALLLYAMVRNLKLISALERSIISRVRLKRLFRSSLQ